MPRNSFSPTYTPYADAAMIASKGINITFDDAVAASRFQRGFSSWVARQMGYEGLSTHRHDSVVRILNTSAVHLSAVVTDAETGAAIAIGQDHDPSLADWSLDDLSGPSIRAVNPSSPSAEETLPPLQQIPEEGLDLE